MSLKHYHISILHYWNNGVRSPRDIARKCNLPVSTVHYNLRKLATLGYLEHRGGNGRKCHITNFASRSIGQMIRHNNETTTKHIAMRLRNEKGLELSRITVHRHLHHMGYKNVLPQSKPMLTEEQRIRRLEWAIAHRNDDWDQTIFCDETSIQLFRNTVRRWTKNPQNEMKRVPKCRQKVMVWGAISFCGTIGLCLFKGIMDARLYVDILKKNLLPAARR